MNDSDELREAVKLWLNNEYKAITKYGHIVNWDTSKVTSMSGMFCNANKFNQDIGNWDTSNVTNMKRCLVVLKSLINIGGWNTSKVTNMIWMFENAYDFNEY